MRNRGTKPIAAGARLARWLDRSKTGAAELARRIGCTGGRVSQIIAGNGRPSPELAHAIERETGIPAASWFALSENRAVSR